MSWLTTALLNNSLKKCEYLLSLLNGIISRLQILICQSAFSWREQKAVVAHAQSLFHSQLLLLLHTADAESRPGQTTDKPSRG